MRKVLGHVWKTPTYIFHPKVRNVFGVLPDERLIGFVYLTDLEDDSGKEARRKNRGVYTEYI